MSDRQRTTWPNDGDRTAEVLPVERAASAHPATPDEGAAHPANQPDPGEHDYENGDTSSWAEDPDKGPHPNSAHPATPDEGAAHPAHKQADAATAKEAAAQLRASVTKKASKTVRIAEALLIPLMRRVGVDPTSEKSAGIIENQALDFLDVPDEFVASTLNRLAELAKLGQDNGDDDNGDNGDNGDDDDDEKEAKKKAADEALLRRLLAEEDGDEDEDGKEASADVVAEDRLAQILEAVQGLGTRLNALEGGTPVVADSVDPDEALLAEMLQQEGGAKAQDDEEDVEAMLQKMVMDDGGIVDEVILDDIAPVDEAPGMYVDELDVQMTDMDDTMGLMAETTMTAEEEALLATLFASDGAMKVNADTPATDANVDANVLAAAQAAADKEATARKPQVKKASQGVSQLGTVQGGGGGGTTNEIEELSKLWPTAPDVSNVF